MDNASQEAFNRAVKYVKGEGVKKNLHTAAVLFTQAATAGHSKAQYHLGVMYARGIGITKDHHQAIHWLTRAADQGDTQAVHSLTKLQAAQVARAPVKPEKNRLSRSASEKMNAQVENSFHTPAMPHVNAALHGKSEEGVVCQSCKTGNNEGSNCCRKCGTRLNRLSRTDKTHVGIPSLGQFTVAGKIVQKIYRGDGFTAKFISVPVAFAIATSWYFDLPTRWKLSGEWECQQNNNDHRTKEKYGILGSFVQASMSGQDAGSQLTGKYSLSKNALNIVLERIMMGDHAIDLDETQRARLDVGIQTLTADSLSYSMHVSYSMYSPTLGKTAQFKCVRL